jgi:hypothetical protein
MMNKCQGCGYENTEVMNFCLECGSSLAGEPQMVVPLETVNIQNAETFVDRVTENYEKETIVNNRFDLPQQNFRTFQTSPQTQRNNSKLFLVLGGGLIGLILLVFTGIAGIAFIALQSQPKPKTLVSIPKETPERSPEIYPEETPEELPEETPQPTPVSKPTPDNETITFPVPRIPTKRATFRVEAVSGWQLSEIKTVSLENFRVQTRGTIKLDGISQRISARGINGYQNRRIFKQFRTGALLMRTHYPNGNHSNIQAVAAGEYWQNYKNETGKIEFFINDNEAENSSGEFTINFAMINVPG